MNTLYDNDIDYEHLDDLPLSDHIEWSQHRADEIITTDFNFDSEFWYSWPDSNRLLQNSTVSDPFVLPDSTKDNNKEPH